MIIRILYIIILLCIQISLLTAQVGPVQHPDGPAHQESQAITGFLPLGEQGYEIFERQAVLSGDSLGVTHLGVYPIQRKYIEKFAQIKTKVDDIEIDQLDYLRIENDPLYTNLKIAENQKTFLKYFWKNKLVLSIISS